MTEPHRETQGAAPLAEAAITFLYTTDLERAADFYERLLGLALACDQGGCRIYRLAETAYLGLCRRPATEIQPPDPARRSVIVTLVVENVDAWHARLAAQGVRFETPPRLNADYGIHHCFLRDPDGHLIEIQRFLDPHWDSSR